MTHALIIIGFIIELGVAGRFDCDAAMGLNSPSMTGWMIAGIVLMIPELIWFLQIMKKVKEMEGDE